MILTVQLSIPAESVPPCWDEPAFVLSDDCGNVVGEVPVRDDEEKARVVADLVIEALKDFEPSISGADAADPLGERVAFGIDDSEWPHIFIYDRVDDSLIYCRVNIGEAQDGDLAEQMASRIMERLDQHLSVVPSPGTTL